MNVTDTNIIRLVALEMEPVDLIIFCSSQREFYEKVCWSNDFWILKLEKDYPNAFNYYKRYNIPFKNPKNIYIRIFKKDAEFVEKSLEHINKNNELSVEEITLMEKFLIYLIKNLRLFIINNGDINGNILNIIDRTSKERDLNVSDKIKKLLLYIIQSDYIPYEESTIYDIFK